MTGSFHKPGEESTRFVDAPTQVVVAAGEEFVYRDLGADRHDGVPLVGLTHLGANLDSWGGHGVVFQNNRAVTDHAVRFVSR